MKHYLCLQSHDVEVFQVEVEWRYWPWIKPFMLNMKAIWISIGYSDIYQFMISNENENQKMCTIPIAWSHGWNGLSDATF